MVSTGSSIKNGTFSLSAEHGLIPDQVYSVQFRSVEEISGTRKETSNPMETAVETRDLIPSKYGVDSKETVTATKKSPNVFRFELTSESSP
jgi:hypothetical protein